jgi:hypothetical protein
MNYHSAAGTGQPNGSASRREKLSTQRHPADDNRMHPALRSWREELPTSFVRLLAYLGAVALLSIGAAHVSQSPKVMTPITPVHQPEWIEVERPFPAFALSIPEAADMPARYVIQRTQGYPYVGRTRQRVALSTGRDLPARQRDQPLC